MSARHIRYCGWCLLAAAVLCGLSSCLTAGTISPTRYYAVEPQIEVAAVEQVPCTLGLRALASARPYDTRMAYRDSDLRIGYRDTEWAELPSHVVTRALDDAIDATGRFSDSGNAIDMARPDLMLTGELRRFYEDRGGTPAKAVVELGLEVREARGEAAPWDAIIRAEVPIEGAEASAVAIAMSEAVAQAVREAAAEIARLDCPD